MLKLHNLTVGYNGRPILHELSLELQPGQMVALIGANGAGKSTLLHTMNRTLKPWSGWVELNGHNLWRLSPTETARQVALVEQAARLAWPYTVKQVLKLGRFPHQGWFAPYTAHDLQIVDTLLQQTGLWELQDRQLNTLSGGERQLALIARSLAQQPRFLLLDEPSSNLDINHQLKLLEFVRSLVHEQGLAVVIAIHDLSLAARYCQRLVVLHDGRIHADGPIEQVLNPTLLAEVFGVEGRLYRDPFHRQWTLSVAGSNGQRPPSPGEL
jgi:iron complex transport system ATP-binding protein